jgi:hypothetical protein
MYVMQQRIWVLWAEESGKLEVQEELRRIFVENF